MCDLYFSLGLTWIATRHDEAFGSEVRENAVEIFPRLPGNPLNAAGIKERETERASQRSKITATGKEGTEQIRRFREGGET